MNNVDDWYFSYYFIGRNIFILPFALLQLLLKKEIVDNELHRSQWNQKLLPHRHQEMVTK